MKIQPKFPKIDFFLFQQDEGKFCRKTFIPNPNKVTEKIMLFHLHLEFRKKNEEKKRKKTGNKQGDRVRSHPLELPFIWVCGRLLSTNHLLASGGSSFTLTAHEFNGREFQPLNYL